MVHATFDVADENHGTITRLMFALPLTRYPRAPGVREPSTPDLEPPVISRYFQTELALSAPVADVVAWIITMGLTGGLLAWTAEVAPAPPSRRSSPA